MRFNAFNQNTLQLYIYIDILKTNTNILILYPEYQKWHIHYFMID